MKRIAFAILLGLIAIGCSNKSEQKSEIKDPNLSISNDKGKSYPIKFIDNNISQKEYIPKGDIFIPSTQIVKY